MLTAAWVSVRHTFKLEMMATISTVGYLIYAYGFFPLTFLLANFTIDSNDRWWLARGHLGALCGNLKEFSMQCRSYTLGQDDKRERCWGTVRYVCAAIACFIENNTEGVGVFAGWPSQLTTSANGLPPLLTPKDCKILSSQFKVSSIQEAL